MGTQDISVISPLSVANLILLGCLGGFLVEALKYVRKLQGRQLPDAFDIAVSLILILVGGGVAGVYVGQVQSALIAVQVGATAPAIIGAWASGGPPPPGGGGRGRPGGGGAVAVATERAGAALRALRALSWNTPTG